MSILNSLYTNLKEVASTPSVEVQSFTDMGNGLFKVVAAFKGNIDEGSFGEAVIAMTGGKARVLTDSFAKRGQIAVATVAANVQSKLMDASFTILTASQAMDASGTIWSVVNQDGTKRVVLESSDDLAEILAARQANRKIYANPVEGRGLTVASFDNGNIVKYVDPVEKATSWGFAFKTEDGIQIAKEDRSLRIVTPEMIVATVAPSKLDEKAKNIVEPVFAKASLDNERFNTIVDYLKKAFPKSAMTDELFAKYAKLARAA